MTKTAKSSKVATAAKTDKSTKAAPPMNQKYKKRSQFKEIVKRFCKNKIAVLGLCIILIMMILAICADMIVPYEKAITQNISERLLGPSSAHIFGTDELGRDLFARIIHGSRRSLFIGLTVSALTLVVGVFTGAVAAFYGGLTDMIIMRITDIIFSLPVIVICIIVIAVTGVGTGNLIFALVLANFVVYTRLIRSSILSIKNVEYVEAARAIGCGNMTVIMKHIVPNVLGPCIIQAFAGAGGMIIWISSLSFIGLGVQPPVPEWGSIMSLGKQFMVRAPHMIIITGLVMMLTAISLNLFGDGVRDALDPKQKK